LHGQIDLKGIPLEIIQDHIELYTSIPLAHQERYRLNLNYVVIVKQDIEKLLDISFIKLVEEATYLSPIMGSWRIVLILKNVTQQQKKTLIPCFSQMKSST